MCFFKDTVGLSSSALLVLLNRLTTTHPLPLVIGLQCKALAGAGVSLASVCLTWNDGQRMQFLSGSCPTVDTSSEFFLTLDSPAPRFWEWHPPLRFLHPRNVTLPVGVQLQVDSWSLLNYVIHYPCTVHSTFPFNFMFLIFSF